MRKLRRGWYLGEPTFADRLRAMIRPEQARGAGRDAVARSHDAGMAEELAKRALKELGLPTGADALAGLRKGAPEKVLISVLLRERTSLSKGWITQPLAMGYTGAVSHLTGIFHRDTGNTKRLRDLEEMLK